MKTGLSLTFVVYLNKSKVGGGWKYKSLVWAVLRANDFLMSLQLLFVKVLIKFFAVVLVDFVEWNLFLFLSFFSLKVDLYEHD